MQTKQLKQLLSVILCTVLIAAMALVSSGCSADKTDSGVYSAQTVTFGDGENLGEGKNNFTLQVTDKEGKKISCTVNTDKDTVGDALLELNVIDGSEGDYGLYIKTVNGITVDYDKDGKYWAFYVNGKYAQKGIDLTEITNDSTYALKVE